ncbi:MAG: WD40 repeat domain-containing protein [Marinifilaceae bacterium]
MKKNTNFLALQNTIAVNTYGVRGLSTQNQKNSTLIAYGVNVGNSSPGNKLVVHDLQNNQNTFTKNFSSWNTQIHYFGNGELAVANSNQLNIFDQKHNLIKEIPNVYKFAVRPFHQIYPAKFLVTFSGSSIKILDAYNNYNEIQEHKVTNPQSGQDATVAISNNEKWIALTGGYEKKNIQIYNTQSGFIKEIHLEEANGTYSPVFFNNDKYLAIGGGYNDGRIYIIRTQDWTLVHTIQAFGDYVYTINCTPDGKHIMAGGFDGTLKFYETMDWTEVSSENIGQIISEGEFSADMKHLYIGTEPTSNNSKVLVYQVNWQAIDQLRDKSIKEEMHKEAING